MAKRKTRPGYWTTRAAAESAADKLRKAYGADADPQVRQKRSGNWTVVMNWKKRNPRRKSTARRKSNHKRKRAANPKHLFFSSKRAAHDYAKSRGIPRSRFSLTKIKKTR